jgi:8-oxo-dGTP pyrophosphatase MutT (NUDIX family)
MSEAEAPSVPRAAATILLLRRGADSPSVLMGQRGAAAVFMPSKYVFPGGAVDEADALGPELGSEFGPEFGPKFGPEPGAALDPTCRARLAERSEPGMDRALLTAARRELVEETGLTLSPGAPLRFVFRAITPPGRSRRFDARFFLADADAIEGSADDFSAASDELSHLHWVALAEARRLDLPFVTEVVLAELAALLRPLPPGAALPVPASVPFFDNSGPVPMFRRLGIGQS